LEAKSAALVAAVFVDFPKNKCNFLHNNKLDIVRRVQFLTGRRAVMSFSPGAVATIAPWKSAPMVSRVPWLTTCHCPHLLRRAAAADRRQCSNRLQIRSNGDKSFSTMSMYGYVTSAGWQVTLCSV